MVNFTRVTARDAFAYATMEFDFTAGIHSISGLNGASKSSVFLVLCQALFNRHPKGGKVEEVNNNITGEPYEIEVWFTKGRDSFHIVNSRKGKATVTLEKNNKDVSLKTIPATLKLIEEVIGSSYETFVSLSYRNSDSRLDLVEEAGDVARKNFIGKILKFAELDQQLEAMKARAKELKGEVNGLAAAVGTIDQSILPLKVVGELKDTDGIAAELAQLSTTIEEKQSLVSDTRAKLNDVIANRDRQIDKLTDTTAPLMEKLQAEKSTAQDQTQAVERIAWLKDKLAGFTSTYASAEEAGAKHMRLSSEHTTMAAEVRAEKSESVKAYGVMVNCQAEYNRLKSSPPETVCSKCGQDLDADNALAVYEKELADAKVAYDQAAEVVNGFIDRSPQLAALEEQVATAAKEVKKFDAKEKLERELETATAGLKPTREVAEIDREVEVLTAHVALDAANLTNAAKVSSAELEEELSNLQTYVDMLKKSYIDLNSHLTNSREYNTIQRTCEEFNKETSDNNARLTEQRKEKAQALEKAELDLELVTTWVSILGPNGYRVQRMQRFLALLNETMTKYATMVADGTIRCMFFINEDGKIDFRVTDADKTISYCMWSDGEKARVKLVCLFAVLELLEVTGDSSYNLLFLDEVFASLDERGREGLFNVLAFLKGNGKCVYTIAHSPIANAVVFDQLILAEKNGGLATLSLGG